MPGGLLTDLYELNMAVAVDPDLADARVMRRAAGLHDRDGALDLTGVLEITHRDRHVGGAGDLPGDGRRELRG